MTGRADIEGKLETMITGLTEYGTLNSRNDPVQIQSQKNAHPIREGVPLRSVGVDLGTRLQCFAIHVPLVAPTAKASPPPSVYPADARERNTAYVQKPCEKRVEHVRCEGDPKATRRNHITLSRLLTLGRDPLQPAAHHPSHGDNHGME